VSLERRRTFAVLQLISNFGSPPFVAVPATVRPTVQDSEQTILFPRGATVRWTWKQT